jgi:hypothetical protein
MVKDVDWIASPLATLLGGGIVGAGSALLLDYIKSRRDISRQWQDARREVYVDYLTELSKVYESLWALALGDHEDASRDINSAARQILRAGSLYQTRQRLKIVASVPVIRACDVAFDNLKTLRITVGQGRDAGSPEFLAANQVYRVSVQLLHRAIRADLRIPHSPDDEEASGG